MRVVARGPLGNVTPQDNTRNISGGFLAREPRSNPDKKTFPLDESVEVNEMPTTLPSYQVLPKIPPLTPMTPKLPPLTPLTPQIPYSNAVLPRPLLNRNILLNPTPNVIPSIRIQTNANLIPGGKIIRRPKKFSTDEEWHLDEKERRKKYNTNYREKNEKKYLQFVEETKISVDKNKNELILINLRLDRAYEAIKRLERIIDNK